MVAHILDLSSREKFSAPGGGSRTTLIARAKARPTRPAYVVALLALVASLSPAFSIGCASTEAIKKRVGVDYALFKSAGSRRGFKPYTINNVTYYPLESAAGFRQSGLASWYGPAFHGKLTASGEKYDMNALTAAHKTVPLGTYLIVKNSENGRSIKVRVNDRGPFVGKRIIDLSHRGARDLGFAEKGTAWVHLRALEGSASVDPDPREVESSAAVARAVSSREKGLQGASEEALAGGVGSYPTSESDFDLLGKFYVQVGAFSSPEAAERMAEQLTDSGQTAEVKRAGTLTKTRVGPYSSLQEALRTRERLRYEGHDLAFIQAE